MKVRSLSALTLALILILTSCAASPAGSSAAPSSAYGGEVANKFTMDNAAIPAEAPPAMAWGDNENGQIGDASYTLTTTSGNTLSNAKLILRADLSLESTEFDTALTALDALVARCGGYFSSSEVWGGNAYSEYSSRSAYYTVRVPRDRYDEFLSDLGGVAHIVRQQKSAEDIGEQYYDTELRLNTARVKYDRLIALLEKADKMEDIITIENSIAQTQYEIDNLSGTLRRYDDLVGFSTISISLAEVKKLTETPAVTVGDRMAAALSNGLGNTGDFFVEVVLFMAYNAILFSAIAVAAVAVVVTLRRRRRRRRSAAPGNGADGR